MGNNKDLILKKVAEDSIIGDHVKQLQQMNFVMNNNIEAFHNSLGVYDLKSQFTDNDLLTRNMIRRDIFRAQKIKVMILLQLNLKKTIVNKN